MVVGSIIDAASRGSSGGILSSERGLGLGPEDRRTLFARYGPNFARWVARRLVKGSLRERIEGRRARFFKVDVTLYRLRCSHYARHCVTRLHGVLLRGTLRILFSQFHFR